MRDLATLSVGDEVVIVGGSWHTLVSAPQTVVKIGKRDLVLSGGRRFNVNNGREVGRTYSYDRLALPTDPEVVEAFAQDKRRDARKVMRSAWDDVVREGDNYTRESIDALRAALDAAEALL